jgi:hypothetical protein
MMDFNVVDFGYYLIGDRQVMAAMSSSHDKFANDRTAFAGARWPGRRCRGSRSHSCSSSPRRRDATGTCGAHIVRNVILVG